MSRQFDEYMEDKFEYQGERKKIRFILHHSLN